MVPQEVLSSCILKYGDIGNAVWTSVADTVYVAAFIYERHTVNAFFDQTGRWLKSETKLKSSEVPAAVVNTVTFVYPGRSISKACYVEKADEETTYMLTLKRGRNVEEVELSTLGAVIDNEE